MRSWTTENVEATTSWNCKGASALFRVSHHPGATKCWGLFGYGAWRSLPVLQDGYGLFLPCLGCTLTEDFHLSGDHTNKTCEDSKMAHAVFGWEKLKRTSLLTSLGCSPQKAYQSPPTKGPRNQRFPPFCFGAGNLSLAFHCLLELYNYTYIYIKILVYKCGRYSFIYLLWLRNGTTGTIAISLNWIFLKLSAPAPPLTSSWFVLLCCVSTSTHHLELMCDKQLNVVMVLAAHSQSLSQAP